ncbi:MAG: prepilin peptidase [Rhodobacteraceae bacterium]|nr:prepilin peptidase [Paracoccaceae bacterium]
MTSFSQDQLLILLLSPAIGSFIGLLADRLPRGEPIALTRSACRSCARPLAPRDLMPVLSFLITRGRCRHCGATLPGWLLYTELAAIGLAVWAVMVAEVIPAPLIATALWLLLALCLCDLLWLRLPDLLTGALALFALGLSWAGYGPSLMLALIGMVCGAGSFWGIRLIYRHLRGREGLGLGDVKLMAGLGALIGPFDLPLVVLIAAASLLAVAVSRALTGTTPLTARQPLPFGAALAAAGGLFYVLSL